MIGNSEHEVLSLQDLRSLEQFIELVFSNIIEKLDLMYVRKQTVAEIEIEISQNDSHDHVLLKFKGIDEINEILAVSNNEYVGDIIYSRLRILQYFPVIQGLAVDVNISSVFNHRDDTSHVKIVIKRKCD